MTLRHKTDWSEIERIRGKSGRARTSTVQATAHGFARVVRCIDGDRFLTLIANFKLATTHLVEQRRIFDDVSSSQRGASLS